MSLLLANGHLQAREYPIGMAWEEAQIVTSRLNGQAADQAILLNMAVASLLSKDAGRDFSKAVRKLKE